MLLKKYRIIFIFLLFGAIIFTNPARPSHSATDNCCYHECNIGMAKCVGNVAFLCCLNCDNDPYQDFCAPNCINPSGQDCTLTGQTCINGVCTGSCSPSCFAVPGCLATPPLHSHLSSGICCNNQSCYACDSDSTWNSSTNACESSCVPSLTCADYQNQCGNNMSDGCSNILDCSGNCSSEMICCNNFCQSPTCQSDNNCNNGDNCTIDVCVNPGTCNAACLHTNITICQDNDNCCLAICNSANDNDCSPSCIPNGCNNNCPTGCTASQDPDCSGLGCNGDGTCDQGECSFYPPDCNFADCCGDSICNNSETSATCLNDCPIICLSDGCNNNCPAGCAGNSDPDCPGQCLNCACATDTDCPSTCGQGDGCCPTCSPADPDCVPADTTPPTVSSFTAAVNISNLVNVRWTASDTGGSHLDRIEIWRAQDNSGSPGTWFEIINLRQTITSQNTDSNSNTVTDNPGSGIWWYGLHVVDQANNMAQEPDPPGPIRIAVLTCIPNGCNGSCPAYCAISDDPDCGCQDNNSCCGIGCNNANDNDCSVLTCSDNTPYNTCSTNPPWYCDNSGNLIENCGICGCLGSWICGPDNTFCCDNQCNSFCSQIGCTASYDPDCACQDNNGCCGIGCNNANDNDCPTTCTPDGCNNNCPAGCTVAQDADCACQDNNGCCGIGCDNTNDNDCPVSDIIAPTIFSFSAINNSNAVDISWTVNDTGGSHLDRIEIWRAQDNSGVPGAWSEVSSLRQTITALNTDTHTGNTADNPGNGIWWYGLHVVDQANNIGTESSPIQVIVVTATCPDGTCDTAGGECSSCPVDCAVSDCCGNGICDSAVGETNANCPSDCAAVCVPNGCNGNCPTNCTVANDPDCACQDNNGCCGIGCDNTNDNDCPATCGNTICDSGEDCVNCPADCGACPVTCPDGVCDGSCDECTICPADCTVSDCCGNGSCNNVVGENNINCPSDCFPDALDWSHKELPTAFPLGNDDWMTPVKNQGACGCCWAFGTVGAIEGVYNVEQNNPDLDIDLAEAYAVSTCFVSGDCNGGSVSSLYGFIVSDGITPEICFPYSPINSNCSDRCADWSSQLWKIEEYSGVAGTPDVDLDLIKIVLFKNGPVTSMMAINLSGCAFDGDIYKCSIKHFPNHAIVIVGYNDAESYWIVKNSWGAGWDGNGYFKVGYNANTSIEEYVRYPIGVQSP